MTGRTFEGQGRGVEIHSIFASVLITFLAIFDSHAIRTPKASVVCQVSESLPWALLVAELGQRLEVTEASCDCGGRTSDSRIVPHSTGVPDVGEAGLGF